MFSSNFRIGNVSSGIVSVLNDSENSSISSSNSSLNDSKLSLHNGSYGNLSGGSTPTLNGTGNGYTNGYSNGHSDSRRSSTSSNASGSARFNNTYTRLFGVGADSTDSTPTRRNLSFNQGNMATTIIFLKKINEFF